MKVRGFTIVELLIVIVVIGILAAITIVAYNGIQQRAQGATIDNAIAQANKKLVLYKVENDTYPSDLSTVGIEPSSVTYQYGTDGSTYCLSATSGTVSHYSTGTTIFTGTCTEGNGLVGWWKFNGNANDDSGNGYGGTVSGATLTTGQNGSASGAYSFDGVSRTISYASNLGIGASNLTISTWFYNPLASNKGAFVKIGGSGGYGIGMGSGNFSVNGNNLILLYENVRWIPTSATITTGWHHAAVTVSSSGVPSAYLDGSFVGTYTGTGPAAPSATTNIGGYTSRFFNGSIDDTRVYDRALTGGEIQSIYAGGAK